MGSELVMQLRKAHGAEQVIASDIRKPANAELMNSGEFIELDVLNKEALLSAVQKYEIGTVYNLAALLSATAEQHPSFGWDLNMNGLFNVLDLAKEKHIEKTFWPSSIAVFGPSTPKQNTPQDCIMDPSTVYGISKLAGERWCEYYHKRWNVDVRSIRYPGLISYATKPGGGTTDYAIEIFHEAISKGDYTCFLKADTSLPMLYMPDAIKATIDITECPAEQVKIRSSYNLAGFSFNPEEIAREIGKVIDGFTIDYKPDFRQQIADSWPASINDSPAREHWGWENGYNLEKMVEDMIFNLKKQYSIA